MHAPQIIWIALMCASLGFSLARDGQQQTIRFGANLIGAVLVFWLLYWGGFFTGGNC